MEYIYTVDPTETRLLKAEPVTLSAIGVRERKDMEQWLVKNPDVLGEPLLVITPQFSRFSKSSRRLDILALDKTGTLVVIEIKLDARGTHADLQAVRYAAFCSTMTEPQVVEELAAFKKTTPDKARKQIRAFVDEDGELLKKPPRIILAAGSFDDQEITASVLWLREFALDISCVELTPHRLGDGRIVLVPKVIIPLPETKDYQVKVEQKKAHEARRSSRSPYAPLWQKIADEFNRLGLNVSGRQFTANPGVWHRYFVVYLGHSKVHYEWVIHKRVGQLKASVHFELPDRKKNLRLLKLLQANESKITRGAKWPYEAAPWGENWAAAQFCLPFSCDEDDLGIAADAARAMSHLITRTWPILKPALSREVEPK